MPIRVPVNWLREYVDVEASVEEIADRLTASGTEVEDIATVGADYEGLVVGEVLSVEQHPSADRLKLCRVSDGESEYAVVCGADNFKVGDRVPFAPVGSTLPDGTRIRKAKLRGEESFGMLCAEDELGLSDDHGGLMILPSDLAAGTPLVDVLGGAEQVLVLEVTWNRPDCLSVIGMAREVAALYGTELKLPPADIVESGGAVEDRVNVEVHEPDLCPRYTARVLSDVALGPSPMWMQQRLRACRVRPISNIVDVTNYVLLECGHPLHAFDARLLSGNSIIVRRAGEGEKMATLDGVERELTADMLVIADTDKAVAVAGVMGGADSEIREDTSTVLLESASFAPPQIRHTSSRLGLSTESSYRFERGVSADTVEWASRRAARLMIELAGGVLARGVVDAYPGKPRGEHLITCRYKAMRDLIGIDVSAEQAVSVLTALQIPVVEQTGETCTVQVPPHRWDLEREADIIEEVIRMVGLDSLPATLPAAQVVDGADDSRTRAVYACRHRLVGLGLTETMSYSFGSARLYDEFSTDDHALRVVLPNPVSSDYAVMRHTLLPEMVQTLGRNLAHQCPAAGLFELGNVFLQQADGSVVEEDRLCIGLMGHINRPPMDTRRPVEPAEMFSWIKGLLERLFEVQHVGACELEPVSEPYYEPGAAVAVKLDGESIGSFGILGEKQRARWRMLEPVAVAELRLDPLLSGTLQALRMEDVSTFPGIWRDVAVVVDESVQHGQVESLIRTAGPPELTALKLFDIFRSEGIGKDRKSLAYTLCYRSLERTLTDDEANGYHDTVKAALRSELGAEIREG